MTDADGRWPDPYPEVEWEVWHQDMFDRDTPQTMEVSGRGLARGLTELWARHLFVTVGKTDFSRFHLWWTDERKRIDVGVYDDTDGATRVREWVYGTKRSVDRGYVEDGDADLLRLIATTHATLVVSDRNGEKVLAVAATAQREDFEERVLELTASA